MIILRYLIGYEYKKADFGRNKQKSVKPRYYLVNQNAILRNIGHSVHPPIPDTSLRSEAGSVNEIRPFVAELFLLA